MTQPLRDLWLTKHLDVRCAIVGRDAIAHGELHVTVDLTERPARVKLGEPCEGAGLCRAGR